MAHIGPHIFYDPRLALACPYCHFLIFYLTIFISEIFNGSDPIALFLNLSYLFLNFDFWFHLELGIILLDYLHIFFHRAQTPTF